MASTLALGGLRLLVWYVRYRACARAEVVLRRAKEFLNSSRACACGQRRHAAPLRCLRPAVMKYR